MVRNFLSGGAAINVLARHCGARLMVVDAGIRGPVLTEVGSRFHGNDGGEDGKDEATARDDEGADGNDVGTDGNDDGADGNDVDTGGNDGGGWE